MKVIEYNQEKELFDYLNNCEWVAGKYLANVIANDKMEEEFGNEPKVFFLYDEKPIAFLVLVQKDSIIDDTLSPWIGFVYVDITYRGHRYSELLIKFALQKALEKGYKKVYISTDHINLYEKFGFTYLESRLDKWKTLQRIYFYSFEKKKKIKKEKKKK